jgi:hypothetical protein
MAAAPPPFRLAPLVRARLAKEGVMSLFSVLATLPIFLAVTSPGEASTWLPREQAVPQEFAARVNHYVEIHRLVTAPLGPPEMCSDPEELLRQERAFAKAIRGGRPDAREGDIFTPEAARYFRALIAKVAWERGLDFVGELEDAAAWDTEAAVDVNAQLPWNAGPMMWPSVLWRLPELPPELEYRFVGRDLVLIDVIGNVVVDVLRESLPISERWGSG